jgi:hypothetical protein
MKLKVEGFENLERDVKTNAIVNTSKNEYTIYMKRMKVREQQSDQIRSTIKEINTLKQELFEIKNLLKEVIKK